VGRFLTKPTVANKPTLILKSPPETTGEFEFTVKYYQNGIDLSFFEFKTAGIPEMQIKKL